MSRIGLIFSALLAIGQFALGSPITRELWNDQIDLMLYLFDTAAKEKITKLEFIPALDLAASNITLTGVKLGLMWTLKRNSDVYMEVPNKGEMGLTGRFTLKNFKLLVNNFKYDTHSGPANLTAGGNALQVSYIILNKDKPRHCRTEWKNFELMPFKSLIIHTKNPKYNNLDITERINSNFIPEINVFFQSPEFHQYLEKHWDFCFSKFFK